MKLSKDNIEALKSLVKHPGWKVVEQLEEEARIKLGQGILDVDLSDEKNLKIIKENQIYTKARANFLQNIKKHTAEIYNPVDSLI